MFWHVPVRQWFCLSTPGGGYPSHGGVPLPGPAMGGYPTSGTPRQTWPRVPHLRYPPQLDLVGSTLMGYPTLGTPQLDLAEGYPTSGNPPPSWTWPWGVPWQGYPDGGYPISGNPHWTWLGVPQQGGTQGGVPPSDLARGYPTLGTPPGQTWLGGTPSRVVLDTPRSVCLLRSAGGLSCSILFIVFPLGRQNKWNSQKNFV